MRLQHRLQRLSHDHPPRPVDASGDGWILPPFRLKTVADVLALLEEQVRVLQADEEAGPLQKARTAGYLAGVALRAIETGNLAARIEMLERVLKLRAGEAEQ